MASLLEGKRVVVTGASRGLGRAFAEACAAHGADVVINGRDEATLAETRRLVEGHGVRCEAVAGSVADHAVCEALVARSVETFGGIDCLVNNAGITRDRTLGKMTEEEFDDVIATHLRGTWACAKAASLAMRETGGSIVNVTSNTGLTGAIGQTNYSAAKAGIIGMTRTWTRELARYGIRVNAIWPIAVTDMTEAIVASLTQARETEGQTVSDPIELGFGRPDDVAAIVVYLASDRAAEVKGQVITFNGRKLALWTHPREVAVREQARWTVDALADEFAGPLRSQLQPLYDAF